MTDTDVDRRLTDEEAAHLHEMLDRLKAEMDDQLMAHRHANTPIPYTVLARDKYQQYLERRYGVGDDAA